MTYLMVEELHDMHFKSVGKNVYVSDKAVFHNPGNISIGDNSRIDDFCMLSAGEGGIVIGKHVHISCYASLLGKGKITLEDFVAVSVRASIFSSSDDYSGNFMTNPTVPEHYTNVQHAGVTLEKHVMIGAGSIVLPGVVIGRGTVIGALSLVKKSCGVFGVYCGVAAKLIKERERGLLRLEEELTHAP